MVRQRTNDPYLKEALRLLEPIFNRGNADLHFQNMMVRLKSGNEQLVLMDPVIS